MIFVTVGTHQQPFTRLLDALGRLPADNLVVQYGPAAQPPVARLAQPFMPFDQMAAYMKSARVVITHAGVGSIILAVRSGHRPIAIPRSRAQGEHVDDHQSELTAALEGRGIIRAVWDVDALPGAANDTTRLNGPPPTTSSELSSAVHEALTGRGSAIRRGSGR